jgi:ribosomal protein L40E
MVADQKTNHKYWVCKDCDEENFLSDDFCRRCGASKPGLKPKKEEKKSSEKDLKTKEDDFDFMSFKKSVKKDDDFPSKAKPTETKTASRASLDLEDSRLTKNSPKESKESEKRDKDYKKGKTESDYLKYLEHLKEKYKNTKIKRPKDKKPQSGAPVKPDPEPQLRPSPRLKSSPVKEAQLKEKKKPQLDPRLPLREAKKESKSSGIPKDLEQGSRKKLDELLKKESPIEEKPAGEFREEMKPAKPKEPGVKFESVYSSTDSSGQAKKEAAPVLQNAFTGRIETSKKYDLNKEAQSQPQPQSQTPPQPKESLDIYNPGLKKPKKGNLGKIMGCLFVLILVLGVIGVGTYGYYIYIYKNQTLSRSYIQEEANNFYPLIEEINQLSTEYPITKGDKDRELHIKELEAELSQKETILAQLETAYASNNQKEVNPQTAELDQKLKNFYEQTQEALDQYFDFYEYEIKTNGLLLVNQMEIARIKKDVQRQVDLKEVDELVKKVENNNISSLEQTKLKEIIEIKKENYQKLVSANQIYIESLEKLNPPEGLEQVQAIEIEINNQIIQNIKEIISTPKEEITKFINLEKKLQQTSKETLSQIETKEQLKQEFLTNLHNNFVELNQLAYEIDEIFKAKNQEMNLQISATEISDW